MKKYIDFQIEERRFSSNALLGVYINENGQKKTEFLFAFSYHVPKPVADEQVRCMKALFIHSKYGKFLEKETKDMS